MRGDKAHGTDEDINEDCGSDSDSVDSLSSSEVEPDNFSVESTSGEEESDAEEGGEDDDDSEEENLTREEEEEESEDEATSGEES